MCLRNIFRQFLLASCLLAVSQVVFAALSPETALTEAYSEARGRGGFSHYPFTISSREQGSQLSADVFMQLDVGFPQFRSQLQVPKHWCEFLILTLNIKSCVSRQENSNQYLVLYAGRKEYQPPEITYQLKYAFRIEQNRPQYFDAKMYADKGPMLTQNYNIEVQAIPDGPHTLLHLRMSYETSVFSRAATFTYLNTLGRNKIGFTITGHDKYGKPIYIDGVKAIIERNVMRYFLALNVYLDNVSQSQPLVFRTLLQQWFAATEKYHAQLYEYERPTYIKAKLREYLNQQALQQKADSKVVANRKDRQGG